MRLSTIYSILLNNLKIKKEHNFSKNETEITGLAKDSRKIKHNFIFFATTNDIQNSHVYLDDALKSNAIACIIDDPNHTLPEGIPYLIVDDAASAYSLIANAFYNYPARKMKIIGITGTNGKTTITYLLESIFKEANFSPGIIGTINYRYKNKIDSAKNTTPEATEYQELLSKMNQAGVTHVITEISSHALSLRRVDGLDLDSAIFTNLTQDHLDFHKNFEDYFQAKMLLFTKLLHKSNKQNKSAIINIDDNFGERLCSLLSTSYKDSFNIYSVSCQGKNSSCNISKVTTDLSGSKFHFTCPLYDIDIETPLIGIHNVYNVSQALVCAATFNIEPSILKRAIKKCSIVPGRLERIENNKNIHIFVDYAHTPAALENVLKLMKHLAPERIITVFGCGGDRDKTKRPLMGAIAAKFSDIVIVTSDNPRTEDPEEIINDIVPGITKYKDNFIQETNRERAIEKSIDIARADDIIIIAGKGHEDYQILGKNKIHFCDKEVARNFLNEN